MSELKHLIEMVSKDKLDTMSGKQKLAYRYCLCAIFINIIAGAHYTKGQERNISLANEVTKLPRKQTNFAELAVELSKTVDSSFEQNGFVKPYDGQMINRVVVFFRSRLQELMKEGISLIQAKEVSGFLDVKDFYSYPFIGEHHWLEFTLHRHLTLTIPEGIIFSDLKVQWNTFVELWGLFHRSQEGVISREDEFNFYNQEQTRENMYKLVATFRTLIILSVSFVEAYLYNLFYCIKEVDFPEKLKIKEVLGYKKIEDTQIVRQVIYILFPEIQQAVDTLFGRYKQTVEYRDRYIHASAFVDQSDNSSELEPLLKFDLRTLVTSLQNSIDFVREVDKLLPSNLQILFWWYDDEINFSQLEKLQLTSSLSPMNRNQYRSI